MGEAAEAIEDFDAMDDVEKRKMATVAFWLLTADGLKRKGLLIGGPQIDREAMGALLRHAEASGFPPDKSGEACRTVLAAVAKGDF